MLAMLNIIHAGNTSQISITIFIEQKGQNDLSQHNYQLKSKVIKLVLSEKITKKKVH